MNILFIFVSSLFFLWCVRSIFYWLSLWQFNTYRPDRFFAYFRRKKRGVGIFFKQLFLIKLIVFLAYGFVIFNDSYLSYYQYSIVLLYLVQAGILFREIYVSRLKKPTLHVREGVIFLFTLVVIALFFSFPLVDSYFWLLLIDLLLPLIVSFFVFLLLFPIEIYDDWRAEKALQKIRSHHKLLVIGVTGSVGKSQTKDFIAHVLNKKFRVIKTEGKQNTVSGIASTILNRLQADTEIFVAELSAYRKGEIAALCQFVQPKIGVLTAINSYYLPLFKTTENIRKTNYELVESLPSNGFCVFNGDNKNTQLLYKKSRKKKVLYGSTAGVQIKKSTNTIFVSNLAQTAKSIVYDLSVRGETLRITTASSQKVEHLLPGIFIAHSLGVSNVQIKKAVSTFPQKDK